MPFYTRQIVPGSIYIFERLYRSRRQSQKIALLSVTLMSNKVVSVELAKMGPFARPYKEGQYSFIRYVVQL
jgi:hypothetical protein